VVRLIGRLSTINNMPARAARRLECLDA